MSFPISIAPPTFTGSDCPHELFSNPHIRNQRALQSDYGTRARPFLPVLNRDSTGLTPEPDDSLHRIFLDVRIRHDYSQR